DGQPAVERPGYVRDRAEQAGRQHRSPREPLSSGSTTKVRDNLVTTQNTMVTKNQFVGAAIATAVFCAVASVAAAQGDVADEAMRGDGGALRSLLQKRDNDNDPQVDGATALHWAVYRSDLEAVNLLIAAGADEKAANREGVTPL